jgi:hypothetical protein
MVAVAVVATAPRRAALVAVVAEVLAQHESQPSLEARARTGSAAAAAAVALRASMLRAAGLAW